jgi:hypothetical protein
VKIFMPAGAKTPIYAPYVEHVPPDATAAIFWLKKRDPARRRDAWQLENVTGKYIISDKPLTEDKWITLTSNHLWPIAPYRLGPPGDAG